MKISHRKLCAGCLGVALLFSPGWGRAAESEPYALVYNGEAAKAAGAVIHVDGANASGRMEGSATYPYATLGQALVAAQSGDTIKVAQGVYAENLVVNLPLSLIGGFAGGSSNDYEEGSGGDFTVSLPSANPTRIQGSNTAAAVRFGDVPEGRLEGLILSGGSRGVLSDGWVAVPGILSILHCIVENNGSDENPDGLPGRDWYGGGLCLGGQHAELIDCIIRNNRAARGAGLNTGRIQCSIEDTLIENNIGSSDHGGGAFVSGQATIRNSAFRGNVIGALAGYGWGGGLIVNSASNMPVLIEGCVFTGNSAPSYGSGLFLDDGSVTTVRNCLISKNRASGDGGALAVDGMGPTYVTHVAIENCTLADNLGAASSAILTDSDTAVSVKNCIFSGHTTDVFDRRQINNTLTASYSSTQYPMAGAGNIEGDPVFVDAANSNYQLSVSSPCIDAGANETWMQTATDLDGKPRIVGGIVDMGACEYQGGGFFELFASAGSHGAIIPSGIIRTTQGANVSFVLQPDAYYHVQNVLTNGASVGSMTNFTWHSISASGTITVSFAATTTAAHGTPHGWLAQFGWTQNFDTVESLDQDGDSLVTWQEYPPNTCPTNANSDGDQYNDGVEVNAGADPLHNDSRNYAAMLNHPASFNFYTSNSVQDLSYGQVMISVIANRMRVRLTMQSAEKLGDGNWSNVGSLVEWQYPVNSNKYFFRFLGGP